MNGQVYRVDINRVIKLIKNDEIIPWVKASRPLLAGMYKNKCWCVLGTIPTSILSNTAYLWLWSAPDVPKIIFARHAKLIIPKLLTIYSRLECNCFSEDSARWLKSLGAMPIGPDLYAFWRK